MASLPLPKATPATPATRPMRPVRPVKARPCAAECLGLTSFQGEPARRPAFPGFYAFQRHTARLALAEAAKVAL